jgi:hypothetical protein
MVTVTPVFEVVEGDLTAEQVDAIVTAANEEPTRILGTPAWQSAFTTNCVPPSSTPRRGLRDRSICVMGGLVGDDPARC